MTLKVDLRSFLDEEGNVLALTEQANSVFTFLTRIVLAVSQELLSPQSMRHNNEQPLIDIDLNCNARAAELTCTGSIKANSITHGIIEWHCDTCEIDGNISHWQGSLWDKQKRTIH
jgi:hypothetical protein